MEILQLNEHYISQIKKITNSVIANLPNPDWLICLTNDEIDNLFINPNVIMYGLVSNNKLLSISGLFFDESDFFDITKLLNIPSNKVAEIAESMTLPNARGHNYMLKINQELKTHATILGFEYLIATAHPDNIASNKSLQKLGMKCYGQFLRYGKYLRNYYLLKLN